MAWTVTRVCGRDGGQVKHWHVTSMKCLHTTSEDPNQIYALDYRPDGLKFATAGQDYQVDVCAECAHAVVSPCEVTRSSRHIARAQRTPLTSRASSLPQVRVYDEATKTLQATLSGGIGYQRVGHSNRVFSLRYCSEDENMLLSAGWDNTVQVRRVYLSVCLCG